MTHKQPFIKRGTRSNATARRLITASQNVAPSVLRTTVAHDDIHQPVMRCLSLETATLAGVQIAEGKHFYPVTSPKFAGYFYILYRQAGNWLCSSQEPTVKAYCIAQVESYRAPLQQKLAP